tara:strand:+ start:84 stop:1031 length:948 start_codon:yes stop_codon:yes gene_type:complete
LADRLNSDDVIDILQIFKVIWRGKLLISLITLLFAIFSIYYALSLPNIYKSSTLLKVSSDDQQSQLSSIGSQFSGLASMAGINMPLSGDDKVYYVLETLKSRGFTKILLARHDFSPKIIASKDFIRKSNKIIFDDSIYNNKLKVWTREPNEYREAIPTHLEVHNILMKSFSVGVDKESGFVSLSYSHVSPVFAKEFLNTAINELNKISKTKDQLESLKAVDYLEKEIESTQQKDIVNSINSLITMQLKTKMLSKIKDDYLLSIIDPPYVPEIRSSPNRAIICIFITLIGGFLGVIIVFFRHYFQNSKAASLYSKT